MKYRVHVSLMLALCLAAFAGSAADSINSEIQVINSHRSSRPGPRLPIEVPQTIGPTCPPGTSCVVQ